MARHLATVRNQANADNYCKCLIRDLRAAQGLPFSDPGKEALWATTRRAYGGWTRHSTNNVIDIYCSDDFLEEMRAVGWNRYRPYTYMYEKHGVRKPKPKFHPTAHDITGIDMDARIVPGTVMTGRVVV